MESLKRNFWNFNWFFCFVFCIKNRCFSGNERVTDFLSVPVIIRLDDEAAANKRLFKVTHIIKKQQNHEMRN